MNNIFVIGNGESRRGFDLERLRPLGITIGCNAMYRDWAPDFLVSVDRAMVEEVCRSGYADRNRVMVNDRWYPNFKQHLGVQPLPLFWTYDVNGKKERSYRGWSSGPSAVGFATSLLGEHTHESRIIMIGFDFDSPTERVNNMYKGTDNYVSADKKAIFYGNWVRQLHTIVTNRRSMKFIRLSRQELIPPDLVKLDNFENMNIDDFDQIVK